MSFLSLYIWDLAPDSAGLQLHSLCRAVSSDLPVRREGLMLHLRARLEMSSFFCHLPNIPSFPSATKTGSKEHAERRHLKVILNNQGGGQIKSCPRSQGLSLWGSRQLHVPSGDAVPMSSPTDTSASAKRVELKYGVGCGMPWEDVKLYL